MSLTLEPAARHLRYLCVQLTFCDNANRCADIKIFPTKIAQTYRELQKIPCRRMFLENIFNFCRKPRYPEWRAAAPGLKPLCLPRAQEAQSEVARWRFISWVCAPCSDSEETPGPYQFHNISLIKQSNSNTWGAPSFSSSPLLFFFPLSRSFCTVSSSISHLHCFSFSIPPPPLVAYASRVAQSSSSSPLSDHNEPCPFLAHHVFLCRSLIPCSIPVLSSDHWLEVQTGYCNVPEVPEKGSVIAKILTSYPI